MMRKTPEVQSFLARNAHRMRCAPTKAEVAMAQILDHLGVRYVQQSINFSDGVYRIFDFYLPKRRIVIEVDGPYHEAKKDRKRDSEVNRTRPKYKILRFTNTDVLSNSEEVTTRLKDVLGVV